MQHCCLSHKLIKAPVSDEFLSGRFPVNAGTQRLRPDAGVRYRAEETEVPAAANTVDISASAKERKVRTTTGSNWVPLASMSRRTASSYGRPFRWGQEETIPPKES